MGYECMERGGAAVQGTSFTVSRQERSRFVLVIWARAQMSALIVCSPSHSLLTVSLLLQLECLMSPVVSLHLV